ncbi:MAG TPA: glycoside hydrolase family 38 C-terminal domain-containing protein [Chloroflexota bacterium]
MDVTSTDTAQDETSRSHQGTGPPYRIFLLHHTHWDREWWTTFQEFRIHLVAVIDRLLAALDADPQFRTFLLDGQMIVLRDYLEIRPESRERLVAFMREGRIQCGPWYVLSDEFLVSGEAQIRNLLMGRRVARELDCPIMSAGYLPDTFGHIGQMPQILRGFGIDTALLWRGRGAGAETVKQEFLWEAPDGSTVLGYWFPDGYYRMPFLHFGNPNRPYADKVGRIFDSIERWSWRASTDALLLPYGGDHQPADPHLPGKIVEANEALGDVGTIRWSTPDEFFAAVEEQHPSLDTVSGELRAFGIGAPHVFPGVLSSRLYLKKLNFRGQTWLERYAEPLSALAWLQGHRYEDTLLCKAWELLIQNHAHDSICGCSIDPVHREMLTRFESSWQIARVLAEKAAQHLNTRIDTSDFEESDRGIVVHNSLVRERAGWASVWIERIGISPRTHMLLDESGAEVPFQVRDVEGWQPTTDRWFSTEIGFGADRVPGLGYRTYRLTRRPVPLDSKQVLFTAADPAAAMKGAESITDLKIGTNLLENQFLRVEVDPLAGTVTVIDKTSGEMYEGLNAFEDGGDAGDAYNYSPPLVGTIVRSTNTARVRISVAEAGYARATLRVDISMTLPAGLSDDRRSRSSTDIGTQISTFVSLTSGSRRVDITTEWENGTRDHRLRALFPLGTAVDVSHAQGQFEIVERPVSVQPVGRGWPELPGELPQQGWTAVQAGGRGLMVVNRGLPAYNVSGDETGVIAVTLLRAVGWVSRDDLSSRIGGAGPETPAPDAQSLGPNRVSSSIIPFSGDWLSSRAYELAEEYLVPLYGSSTGVHAGEQPRMGALLVMDGGHTLSLSACKRAETRDELVLRFVNVAHMPTTAKVHLPGALRVRLLGLDEEPIADGEIPVSADGEFTLHAGIAKVLTVGIHELILESAGPTPPGEGASSWPC